MILFFICLTNSVSIMSFHMREAKEKKKKRQNDLDGKREEVKIYILKHFH